jgi:hypothetical protein
MKISPEQLTHMKIAMQPIMDKFPKQLWEDENLSDKRYRWDIARAAKLIPYFVDVLYPAGCDDTHIDTALRKITKKG